MRDLQRWSRLASLLGGIALVVGSFDPLEGSVLILPGSALLAVGSYLGGRDRRIVAYHAWSFVLVAFGIGALLLLTAIGGVGGNSGHSFWWALLILPYLGGWWIDVWGPGAPRWMSVAGVVVGAWYLAILGIALRRGGGAAQPGIGPAVIIGVVGIATIVACSARLLGPFPRTDR